MGGPPVEAPMAEIWLSLAAFDVGATGGAGALFRRAREAPDDLDLGNHLHRSEQFPGDGLVLRVPNPSRAVDDGQRAGFHCARSGSGEKLDGPLRAGNA
jgi:hypothetical protein